MKTTNQSELPKDGFAGLRAHWQSDATSGLLVFLLALPLSLGIAKASDFPAVMGLITAIIGGIVVSFFAGSRLTIKGPAAGLIVIAAGAVAEFGGGEQGWKLALGAIVVASVIQIAFGLLKFGKYTDFFPLAAVHGMLAAIGIIIIGKQIPVLLNDAPQLAAGKSVIGLYASLPDFIANMDPKAGIIGLVSLALMLFWPLIKHPVLKKIPAPLIVLIIAIPAEIIENFKETEPEYALVHIGNFMGNLSLNASFAGVAQTGLFVKYVIMFVLVGSLESLLTVKALDMLDPWHRKSDYNKDLIAVGIGNIAAGLLGGLPMISEVARSSANVNYGAKTRWANFFHGFFLLAFVLVATPFIELIPNCALAAMLISVGIKLAHPKEFKHMLHIGREQLIVFLVTIIFTIAEDLLVGIAAGMLCEIIINAIHGKPLAAIFKAPTEVVFAEEQYTVNISKAAVFTNFLGIKRKLESIPLGGTVVINLEETKLIDHSVMENFHHFKRDYELQGGKVVLAGLHQHKSLSSHHLAARKKVGLA
ncbi:SulP family inorganic anion transporter [Parapedobacter koreensis]|uniref:Sulfate permease, MFS superfamily n=1 Tax=Parapedobacter koreensis TaxID=332977 RepID=A0A1H7FKG6_9SPHI|nr:SulP family inorganic anion transporter [Parapedobacter koreensis]SEK26294.1 Sulfate permease, MFS superfamily [Parapedobacter koreensis]